MDDDDGASPVLRQNERADADPQARLVADELDHRLRNILNVVQAIATQTFGRTTECDAFVHRLAALSRAHDLLAARQDAGCDLEALIQTELAAIPTDRVSVRGPPVVVERPEVVQMFSLILHELATNAAKHGGLSTDDGRVCIRWSVEQRNVPVLAIDWIESGGLPVAVPERSGFGTRLIEACMRMYGGSADLGYPPEGFRANLAVPMSRVGAERLSS